MNNHGGAQSVTLQRGAVLNCRYEVIRLLGVGATGAVYFVRDHKETGKTWAVKELRETGTREEKEIFINEARILSRLSHAGLVKVVDFFNEEFRNYLVMERIEGPTLQHISDEAARPLRQEDVLGWAIQILDVLEYLHNQNPPIIFRDLKPSNVMLGIDKKIKLIDFGIARIFKPMQPKDTHAYGTPGYSPTEQYGRGQTTPASDIFALGVTMYFLLTRKDPEEFRFNFPPVRTFNSLVTPGLETVLSRCLKLVPAERYGAADDLRESLLVELDACRSLRFRVISAFRDIAFHRQITGVLEFFTTRFIDKNQPKV